MSLFARAQHDNNPNRSPQELQFKSGEILRVLHQNPNNLHGWWLCQLNGQTGLAPSNRLQIIGREKTAETTDIFEDGHEYDIPILAPSLNNLQLSKNNGFQESDKLLETRRSFYENLNSYPSGENKTNSSNKTQFYNTFDSQSIESDTMLKQKSSNLNFTDFDTGYDNVDPRTGLEKRQRNNNSPTRKLCVRFKDSSPANQNIKNNSSIGPVSEPWSQPVGGHYGDYFNMRESEYVNSHANIGVKRSSSNSDSNSVNSKSASSSKSSGSSSSKSEIPVVQISKYAANHYSPETQVTPTTVKSSEAPSKGNCHQEQENKNSSDDPLLILRNPGLGKSQSNGSGSRQSNSSNSSIDSKEVPISESVVLNISQEVAAQNLDTLYGNFTQVISKLFRFIHSKWKTEECLRNTQNSLRSTCSTLHENLKEFCHFCQGVLANAQSYSDHVIEKSLWKHMAPMQEKCNALSEEIDLCNSLDWSPEELSNLSNDPETDYLCHIINLVRSISIDVRSLHTNIKANLALLFPNIPNKFPSSQSTYDNCSKYSEHSNHRSRYDRLLNDQRSKSPYAASPDRGSVSPHRGSSNWRSQSPLMPSASPRHNSPMRNHSLMNFRPESPRIGNVKESSFRSTPTRQFLSEDSNRPESACSGNLTPTPNRASERKNLTLSTSPTYDQDHNILKLYSAQLESHGELLGSTMEELLKCLAQNQPPNVFVAHSKFLIKSATQIVHLANSLNQGLSENYKAEKGVIEKLANELCESLKLVIKETKVAAAEFPSLSPIQNLVCAVGKVRENAFHLRRTVRKASSIGV